MAALRSPFSKNRNASQFHDRVSVYALAAGMALLAGLVAFSAFGAEKQSPIERGRVLAEEACSACHQVAPGRTAPPPVDNPDEATRVFAPAFIDIARDGRSDDSLRTAILNPHYPMREQLMSERDVSDLVRYIRSLGRVSYCLVE